MGDPGGPAYGEVTLQMGLYRVKCSYEGKTILFLPPADYPQNIIDNH